MQNSGSNGLSGVVVDVDGTLAGPPTNGDYSTCIPVTDVVNFLKECRKFKVPITLYTSRNMRTYSGNIGKINANTLPILIDWLVRHEIPFDEVVVGKPWPGNRGIYIDDRAIRPKELINKSLDEVLSILDF